VKHNGAVVANSEGVIAGPVAPAQVILRQLLDISEQVVVSGDAEACADLASGFMSAAAYILACTTDPSKDGAMVGTFGRLLADCRNAGDVSEIVADLQTRENGK